MRAKAEAGMAGVERSAKEREGKGKGKKEKRRERKEKKGGTDLGRGGKET